MIYVVYQVIKLLLVHTEAAGSRSHNELVPGIVPGTENEESTSKIGLTLVQ